MWEIKQVQSSIAGEESNNMLKSYDDTIHAQIASNMTTLRCNLLEVNSFVRWVNYSTDIFAILRSNNSKL